MCFPYTPREGLTRLSTDSVPPSMCGGMYNERSMLRQVGLPEVLELVG
jgi:hypothetical protein